MGKKVVLPSKPLRQINQSRALFSFPSHDCLSFSQSWCVLYKRTRAQVPMASSIECLSALLICNEAVVICCKNVLDLQGKKLPCIPQGMKKKNSLSVYLSKFSKRILHYMFILVLCKINYALRADLCDVASVQNSGSPVYRSRHYIILTKLKQLKGQVGIDIHLNLIHILTK